MSFRGDGQRRYGQVPPVQYPVAGHPNNPPNSQQQPDDARRLSFIGGDDAALHHIASPPSSQHGFAHNHSHGPSFSNAPPPSRGQEDELFMGSNTASAFQSASNPLAGYQHTYQDPAAYNSAVQSSYNPQTYASNSSVVGRSQSTTLPHHPHPSSATTYSTASPSIGSTSPSSVYSHQTYNPADYANPTHPQRQQTYQNFSSYEQQYSHQPSLGVTYSPVFSQSLNSPALSSGYQQSLNSPSAINAPSQIPNASYDPSQYANQYPNQYAVYNPADQSLGHQAAYSPSTQMPAVAEHPSIDQTAHYNRPGSHASTISQGLQRHPTNAPLPSRPLDRTGAAGREPSWNSNGSISPVAYSNESSIQDNLMQEIEAGFASATQRGGRPRPAPIDGHVAVSQAEEVRGYGSPPMTTPGHAFGRLSPGRSPLQTSHTNEDEDSPDDPEGAAGAWAMHEAEQNERAQYNSAGPFVDMPYMPDQTKDLPAPPVDDLSGSDSDLAGVDLGALGGGYIPSLSYGDDTARPLPTPGDMNDLRTTYAQNVEVDYGGTGGLQPPREHRLSFDENDEHMSLHSRNSGAESPRQDDMPELFYHPGLSNRPLPALPPASDSSSLLSANNSVRQPQHSYSHSADARAQQYETGDFFYGSAAQQQSLYPERAASMSGHSNTPTVPAPARSHTDSDQHRHRPQRSSSLYPDGMNLATANAPFDGITLPTGRKKKFVPSKLTLAEFTRCAEPWALSDIEAWIREMALGEPDLKEKAVDEALTSLFTHKVPTMNVADAEMLSSTVVASMLKDGVLVPDEEWVKFGDGHLCGVLWQLTGSGCYSSKLHEPEIPGRCYSYHCTRTLKKVDLEGVFQEDSKPTDEWHIFYHLKKEDLDAKPKKEVERQNILHEIVTGEENYIKQLDIFRTLYRDSLRISNPPVLNPDKRDKFLAAVFGKVDVVLQINKDNLLAQLKYRQHEQGPWITGFSDLFREWIRKAKDVYISYATAYPRATYMVRKEASRNMLFNKFLEDRLKHKSSSKQDWTHFLIAPLQRLQRYILLLESVDGKMPTESEEKTNLQRAIDEIKVVTLECDAKVAESNKRVEMMELDRMLVLRPGFQSVLNLDHLGRTLIMQGELQRLGNKGMRWVDTHALLFDHYLILAKVVSQYKETKDKKYDVSREPIPMPLLFLESMNDEPIIKQKGITAPLRGPVGAAGPQMSKVNSNTSGRPGLESSTTGSSVSTMNTLQSSEQEGKILYPFKIKHLGHEVYTLYASSARDRMEWCTKIVEAKTMHAKALYSQNAEPFRLRVLADASFHYDAASSLGRTIAVPVKGTPLDRAIQTLEDVLGSAQGVAPVCRAQVNCATGFSAFGKAVIAVGTDYGVFIADPSNPRGWSRTIQATKVMQIAVLEEFSICLLIADKSLISYPLDVVAPVSEFAPPANDTARRAPRKLAKDVTYFATAKMKERTLVFYKRKEGLHTSFKVLEPLYHKATEKKSRLFGGRKSASGSTDTFRDFDEFFFPVECYSLSIFQTYIAVATAKGVEMLTLDKKQPMSIPDLKAPAIANIASRIRDQRPLGMFRLNENEFILAYEDCAVYVDKHGDVSRTLIMEYTGKQKKARGAAMYGQYLLLFNEDYVEVRNADNGRLRQIIAGRDVRVIDYGIRGPTGGNAAQAQSTHGQNGHLVNAGEVTKETVKIAMSHPELAGRQIILEMLLNDGHVENNN